MNGASQTGRTPSRRRTDAGVAAGARAVGAALSDYPAALVEATLERVIASSTFRRSERHRQFLGHVIRAGLAGRHDDLKEVVLGLEIFGRRLPDYDPRRDPIVRVEVGRIREKLARFYEGEGAAESFQILIPVGSYLPRFARRKFVAHPTNSIAVIPFVNLGGDPDDNAFVVGLADQLIDTLGRVPGIKVVARQSALKARDGGMDLKALGKLLGVNHVVEGSLQRSGSRIRCFAHLSRTKDSARIWSQRFDQDGAADDDLFDWQDRIADAVFDAVSKMGGPSTPDDRGQRPLSGLGPATTDDHRARDLFDRARYLMQQRSGDGYGKAIELLERAVLIDPTFAQAHSHLGSALANLIALKVAPTYPGFDTVKRAALRALTLDPLDGDALSLLATIAHRVDQAWATAEPMFQEAVRLAPNSPLVHSSYAWSLVYNGRFDDAMRHVRLSQELDPLNLGLRANNAAIAKFARLYDHAIGELKAVIELDGRHFFSHVFLGVTYLCTGQVDLAMPHFDLAIQFAPDHPTAHFCRVCVLGLRGRRDAGGRELRALLERLGDSHYARTNLAMAQTGLGDMDDALASMEHAGRVREIGFVALPSHPLFRHHHGDPRFTDLLARHGMAPLRIPGEAPVAAVAPTPPVD